MSLIGGSRFTFNRSVTGSCLPLVGGSLVWREDNLQVEIADEAKKENQNKVDEPEMECETSDMLRKLICFG